LLDNIVKIKNQPYIKARDIFRDFSKNGKKISALNAISLELFSGDACAIIGPSGSGKSTLLNILGLLDSPDAGQLQLAGRHMSGYSNDQLAEIRNLEIGIVFQAFSLLQSFDAVSNVALPLLYRGMMRAEAREHAIASLEQVQLLDRIYHKPADMSGGQRQRVAIARALVGEPRIILADEPTGSLDPENALLVSELLLSATVERGATLVLVTHDLGLAARCNRCMEIRHGVLREVTPSYDS
jgi:putative ABC transport system ATP-binding protein